MIDLDDPDLIPVMAGNTPALARITAYEPYRPATFWRPAEGELEYELLDENGQEDLDIADFDFWQKSSIEKQIHASIARSIQESIEP